MKTYSNYFRWAMFFLSATFFFYEFVLRVTPGIMTDELLQTFQINAKSLGLMSSVFLMSYAFMQIPVGILFDRFSTRKLLFLSCLLCALGTILFAATNFFWIAMIGRFIMGFGAAFGFVGVFKVAEQWLPIKRLGLISGFLMSLGFTGALLSNNILSRIIKIQHWSISLFYLGLFGIILSILLYVFVKDSQTFHEKQKQISRKNFFKGVIEVFKNQYIWINGIIGFCVYSSTSAFAELWGKSYLHYVFHFSVQKSVFASSLVFLGWAVGSPLTGWLSDLMGSRKFFMAAGSLLAAICFSFILIFSHIPYSIICGLLFLFGIFSSTQALTFPYARDISPKGYSATGIAATNMVVVLGGAVSQPLIGWLLDENWSGHIANGVRIYAGNNYIHAFIIIPVLLVIACILSLLLKGNK